MGGFLAKERYEKHVAEMNGRGTPAPAPAPVSAPAPAPSAGYAVYRSSEPEAAEPAAPEAVHEAVGHWADAPATSLVTTPLMDKYRGEHLPGYGGWTEKNGEKKNLLQGFDDGKGEKTCTNTKYSATGSEYLTSVKDGQLLAAGGAVADSTKARQMWAKDPNQRFNFVMDGAGSTYLSDVKKEFMGQFAGGKTTGERIHHSSMLAGKDVAGAGTMRLDTGKVTTLGDGSGHYLPPALSTAQTTAALHGQGVMSPMASIELMNRDGANRFTTLKASTMMAYNEGKDTDAARAAYAAGGDKSVLDFPYAQIVKREAARKAMLREIRSDVDETPAFNEAAAEVAKSAPGYAMSPVLRAPVAPPVAAPAPAPAAPPTASSTSTYDPGPAFNHCL